MTVYLEDSPQILQDTALLDLFLRSLFLTSRVLGDKLPLVVQVLECLVVGADDNAYCGAAHLFGSVQPLGGTFILV